MPTRARTTAEPILGGWEPYGAVDSVTSTAASPFNTNAMARSAGFELSRVHVLPRRTVHLWQRGDRRPTGCKLTMTTTGISVTAVAGTTYTATIHYANVSWSIATVNPSANVVLNILANGVVVGTGTLSGLAQGSPWTPVTASWVATALRRPSDPTPGGGDQLPGRTRKQTVAGAQFWRSPTPL